VWSLAPSEVRVRQGEHGWFDGLAVAPGPLRTVDADALAADVAALFAPLFPAVRARLPYGTAGMWGAVADAIGDPTIIEGVAARVPQLRARPRIQRIPWRDGVLEYHVRGTCCLWHKVYDGVADPDGEGYCESCPHRSDGCRAARVARRLALESA
jgi:hypothetical protein